MKQISLILILALLVTLAACGKQAPALPTEQETVAQTLPEAETFSVKPQTLKGYALTPDGDSVPVQLTMQVEDVRKGEEAEKTLATPVWSCLTPRGQGVHLHSSECELRRRRNGPLFLL